MVGYRRDGWTTLPAQVEVGGVRTVELLGFTSDEPPTVILIGEDGHHLTLHVVDADTNERQAEQALEEFLDAPRSRRVEEATARSVADVARKLALHEGRNDAERDAEILRWCEDAAEQFEAARIQSFVRSLSNTSSTIGCSKPAPRSHRHQTPIRESREPATERPCAKERIANDLLAERRDAIQGLSVRGGIGHNVAAWSLVVRSEGENVRPRTWERAVVTLAARSCPSRCWPTSPTICPAWSAAEVAGSSRADLAAWSGRRRC